MRWVPDHTKRFRWRPWYDKGEIEHRCAEVMERFLHARYGVVTYPVSTDDLTRVIEQEAEDLDLYADLPDSEGAAVEGVTTFMVGRRPRVRISRALSLEPAREVRLRTTLAHELGHVILHNFVGDRDDGLAIPRSDEPDAGPCNSPIMAQGMGHVDWMEWQAGYACGALLMPATVLRIVVQPVLERHGTGLPVGNAGFGPLLDCVQGHFLVSAAAAHMRLRRLGYVAQSLR